ncbi:MAG: VCBS repeat-containing protein, partial [Planctomycetes bacterium]|nr:VCBS repeat-containing protein [Planctomycetota bacterium]
MVKRNLFQVALAVIMLAGLFAGYRALSSESMPVTIADNVLTFVVGDVNSDTYPDIIAGVTDSPQTHNLKLFLNNQNGTFADASSLIIPILQAPQTGLPVIPHIIKLADINDDGLLDIVLIDLNKRFPHNAILLNYGNGAFHETDNLIDKSFNTTPALGISINKSELTLMNPAKTMVFSNKDCCFATVKNISPTISADKPITYLDIDLNNDGNAESLQVNGKKLLLANIPALLPASKSKFQSTSKAVLAGASAPQIIWYYQVTGPDGSDSVYLEDLDKPFYLELDTTISDYVWGNILLLYEADKLESVSIEEDPNNWYGFWTWWTDATGLPEYSGGGNYYYYDKIRNTS